METSQDVERWVRELHAAGWTEHGGSATVWKSPSGDLYRGPYGAWKRMRVSLTPEGRDPTTGCAPGCTCAEG